MTRLTKAACVAALAVVLAGLSAAAAGAASWTQVASGTTQDITAVDFHATTKARFGTANGQLGYADASGAFHVSGSSFPGSSIDSIAFRAAGDVGFATTTTGRAYRSLDGGRTWAPVTLPATVPGDCTATPDPVAIPHLSSVVWAGAGTVYLTGGGQYPTESAPLVLRSTNPAAGSAAFADINQMSVAPYCKVGAADAFLGLDLADGFALPADPTHLEFITYPFGDTFVSTDGLATPAVETGGMLYNGTGPKLAVDPANPQRIWATEHDATICESWCFFWSNDAGESSTLMSIYDNPLDLQMDLYDVGYAAGTLVAAGDDGEIYTSIDGKHAYLQRAYGSLHAHNWRAVGVADASHALVAGLDGVLMESSNANTPPDTQAPYGDIHGPATLAPGQAGTFTVDTGDADGSGVDPGSLLWSADALTEVAAPSATFSFNDEGWHSIDVGFRDLAGNSGSANMDVLVTSDDQTPPPPTTPPATTPATPPATTPTPPAGGTPTPPVEPAPGGGSGGTGGAGGAGAPPPNASGGTTHTTGGATVTVWKRIVLHKGRTVPVRLSTGGGARRVTVELERGRAPHERIATAQATLSGHGSRLLKLPLHASVKPGSYRLVVRVATGGRSVGHPLTFTLAIAR